VANHQIFHDAFNRCYFWIRTFTDQLTSGSEGQNEKEKLQASLDQIEVSF